MLWARLLLPVLMVAGGAGATTVALVRSDEADAGPAQVWIDGPEAGLALAPGAITVSAHATAEAHIAALELLVDGDVVATDHDLDRTQRLVFATFEWKASQPGEHELVVRQEGGSRARSTSRFLVIDGEAPITETSTITTTTSTSTTSPGETTTSPSSTATTEPGSTTTTAPPEGTTTAPPTPGTSTPTATTTPPPDPVVIDSATLVSTYGNRLYVPGCGYSVQVQARVRNAEYASAVVQGTGVEVELTRSGKAWSGTLSSGFDPTDVGVRTVMVLAGNGDDVVDRQAGTVDIRLNCPKD